MSTISNQNIKEQLLNNTKIFSRQKHQSQGNIVFFSSKILGLHLYFRFDNKNRKEKGGIWEGKDPHRERKGEICKGKDQHREELVKNGRRWWHTYFIENF